MKVEINGQTIELTSANYRLPATVGRVQVDCPITRGYRSRTRGDDHWGLARPPGCGSGRPARPGSSRGRSSIRPGSAGSPRGRRWPTSRSTSTAARGPSITKIYYHYGLDIGGAEGLVEVVAATDGLVVSVGHGPPAGLRGHARRAALRRRLPARRPGLVLPLQPPAHHRPGDQAGSDGKMGQKIGLLGKEGGSGGWSHLHFDITSRQPSGKWGTQEGYAFLWEATCASNSPSSSPSPGRTTSPDRRTGRPRRLAVVEPVGQDRPLRVDLHRRHDRDRAAGRADLRPARAPTARSSRSPTARGTSTTTSPSCRCSTSTTAEPLPPSIHAAYAPTFGIKPGDPVTFKVRTFRTTDGEETWDFGDGSPPVEVQSDGNVKALARTATPSRPPLRQAGPLPSPRRTHRPPGPKATARLHVQVAPPP